MKIMKPLFTAVGLLALGFSSSHALEMTAGSRNVQDNAGFEMRLKASNAVLLTLINQMLACNNKDMVFASDTTKAGRDADGCVSIGGGGTLDDLIMVPENMSVDLAQVVFNSPADYSTPTYDGKGHHAKAAKTVSLAKIVDDGATSITISFTRAGFAAGGCNTAQTFIIGNAAQNQQDEFVCHYDNSPNREHNLLWAYDASSRSVTFTSHALRVKYGIPVAATVENIKAAYTVMHVVPRPK